MSARVLVTGATGFIGRHAVSALLERGFDVAAATADGEDPGVLGPGVECRFCDLHDDGRRRRLVQDVRASHLLHLAWNVAHGTFWSSPDNLRWAATSANLFREFTGAGGTRIVGAGTCAEYDWTDGHCTEEVTPSRPSSLYGACKDATFRILAAWARETGTSAAWGRVFHLYGPNEHPRRFVPSMILDLLAGRPASCAHPAHVRDLMHVADVGGAFAAILASGVDGAVNVAAGEPHAFGEIAAILAGKTGGTLSPPAIRPELASSPTDPSRITAETRRLRDAVGFAPHFSLDAGLDDAVAWWRGRAGEA